MIIPSMLRNMTDQELLNSIESANLKSPIIKELYDRLSKGVMLDPPIDKEEVECPVCMANIKVSFDHEANQFNLEV